MPENAQTAARLPGLTIYRRPPLHSRFKPGQSGNRKGRPKGSKSVKTILDRELSALITITEGGVPRKIQNSEALIRSLIVRGIKGDSLAAALVLRLVEEHHPRSSEDKPTKLIVSWRD